EEYLTRALKIAPNNPTALVARGDVYEMMGKTQQAMEDYRQSLALNRDFVPALNNLSYLLSQEGGDKNLNEALPLVQRAKRLSPSDPRVLDTLGWVLSQRGAHSSALAELEDAKKLTPSNPTIYYHLGATYVAMNKLDEAQKDLKKALSLGTDFREKAATESLLKRIEGKR
ncbi:MAG: tetratricopeptide repeat protein, partial [Proteobacteria bacterium]|nr:tetratricopeptide repeat protein [Pseudomonadota bacterium]